MWPFTINEKHDVMCASQTCQSWSSVFFSIGNLYHEQMFFELQPHTKAAVAEYCLSILLDNNWAFTVFPPHLVHSVDINDIILTTHDPPWLEKAA